MLEKCKKKLQNVQKNSKCPPNAQKYSGWPKGDPKK